MCVPKMLLADEPVRNLIRVKHYQRKSGSGFYSIERVFEDIRDELSAYIQVSVAVSRFTSRGLFRRIYNSVEAFFRQAQVNHIVGDVHFLACLLSRKKTVVTIHDCVMMTRLPTFRRWIYWFFWLWLPVHRAAVVTVVSESTRRELLRHVKVSPKKIQVIHNGVSPEFRYSARDICDSSPVFLQIGTTPNKNIEKVVCALKGKKCTLVILGKPTEQQIELLELCEVPYKFFVNLSRYEVLEQYRLADVVLFVSTYEGFGLPILEANAVGRPVITSNRGSMIEIGGDSACLVDPDDVASISDGIDRVVFDKAYRSQLIESGLENVKRFSCAAAAAKYELIYRDLGHA